MTWLLGPVCRRSILKATGMLFLVLSSTSFQWGKSPFSGPTEIVVGKGDPCSYGQATPEGIIPAKTEQPSRERARILTQLGANRWHQLGHRGKGIKIAILDSGFRGYKTHLGKALPAQVTVRSFRQDGNLEARNSQHGILCGEVIHAIAPEAGLLFANWDPGRPDLFLKAVSWAKAQGARILSCSLIMPSWSDGEGGGSFNESLADLVGDGSRNGHQLFFASAGNTAQRHWSGTFKQGRGDFHVWAKGNNKNKLTPWSQDEISVEMYWQCGVNYELQVTDDSTGELVGKMEGRLGQRGKRKRCCAVVRFQPEMHAQYRVRVRHLKGDAGKFHLVVLGGGLAFSRARGSIPCPADGPAAIAVGAVDQKGRRVCYSSCGPNSCLPKPDFVATVPFPSLWRERPFTGTSAAAPQAAGLAALVWSRHPTWKASQVQQFLKKSAKDLGPFGHDFETGHGLIRLTK